MLTSLGLIFIIGIIMSSIFDKLKLPKLIGMILTGIILGPYVLNLLDKNLLSISADLRQIALVIILTRAGLALDLNSLKKVGRPAILMCFVPAIFEIIGFVILGPLLLNLNLVDSLILGAVIAAVSPAVIVPRMINLKEKGYGKKNSIPELILAGASVDDILVITLFYIFTSLSKGQNFNITTVISIPISIILGIILGIISSLLLIKLFKKVHIRDTIKVILIISVSFLFITLENLLKGIVPLSGLLAVMSLGVTLLRQYPTLASRISDKYSKLWLGAEILLFVLVGATVNINYVITSGIAAILIIFGALIFRVIGVLLSLIKTNLTYKERIYCVLAYIPKATVQAAIGAVPLSQGLACGQIVLTVAVLSIIIAAPIGAICMDKFYTKLLK